MSSPTALPLRDVLLERGFLAERAAVVRDVMLPYQWEALNDRIPGAERSGCVHNMRLAAGEGTGEFHGMFWQDSDLYKWIEAASHRLAVFPDATLEREVAGIAELMVKAQQSDGYLNTYFQLAEPDKRFTNLRDCHELYCFGHLIEAAVAWHAATGRDDLLGVANRLAELLIETFGPGERQSRGYPGHEELELALVKLARATGDKRFTDLAGWFVDRRGTRPNFFDEEAARRGEQTPPCYTHHDGNAYWQAHAPVREHDEPVGHAVRAMYLYTAMAGLAFERSDRSLTQACTRLWDAIVSRHLYIIGGVGADGPGGEKFSESHDLPGDRAYAETCAAVGLVFFARRMLDLSLESRFADVMERALYNNVLAGMSLDGKQFFYVNPLEVRPAEAHRRYDHRHVKTIRQPWFGCACCPPNIARLLMSLGEYIASAIPDGVAIHLYTGATVRVPSKDGHPLTLRIDTDMPWDGTVIVTVEAPNPAAATLAFRIPEWCESPRAALDDMASSDLTTNTFNSLGNKSAHRRHGYLHLSGTWNPGERLLLEFPMRARRIRSHPAVAATAGCVALQRGPIVYCFESVDNGDCLHALTLPPDSEIAASVDPSLLDGCTTLEMNGRRSDPASWGDALYREARGTDTPAKLRAIPYALWNNRGETEMRVWMRELP